MKTTKASDMFLFQINTKDGVCFCQASSHDRAEELFSLAHPGIAWTRLAKVADFSSKEEIVTTLSKQGFPKKYDVPLGLETLEEMYRKVALFEKQTRKLRESVRKDFVASDFVPGGKLTVGAGRAYVTDSHFNRACEKLRKCGPDLKERFSIIDQLKKELSECEEEDEFEVMQEIQREHSRGRQ